MRKRTQTRDRFVAVDGHKPNMHQSPREVRQPRTSQERLDEIAEIDPLAQVTLARTASGLKRAHMVEYVNLDHPLVVARRNRNQ